MIFSPLILAMTGIGLIIGIGSAYKLWHNANSVPADPILAQMTQGNRRGMRVQAVVFGLGVPGLFLWLLYSDTMQRMTTLYEVKAPGYASSLGGKPAASTSYFEIEHPGIAHNLWYCPDDSKDDETGSASMIVKLSGPDGKDVVTSSETFEPKWKGVTVPFTPLLPGRYRLEVIPQTPNIADVHIMITDPQKRNGHRMAGY